MNSGKLDNLIYKLKNIKKKGLNEKQIAMAIRTAFKYIAKDELTEDEQKELDRAYKILGW